MKISEGQTIEEALSKSKIPKALTTGRETKVSFVLKQIYPHQFLKSNKTSCIMQTPMNRDV